MNYAKIYIEQNQYSEMHMHPINQVLIYEKMYLPCELIRLNGQYFEKEAIEMEDKSSIEQKIEFNKVLKPSKKSFKLWREFVVWIKAKEIMTIVDFKEMTKDRKYSQK